MQKELNEENMGTPIVILGINEKDKASGNDIITDGRDLPWLQDTNEVNVTGTWRHELRDVVILNPKNQRVGVMGLTSNDLNDEANYKQLKQMFLDAANP